METSAIVMKLSCILIETDLKLNTRPWHSLTRSTNNHSVLEELQAISGDVIEFDISRLYQHIFEDKKLPVKIISTTKEYIYKSYKKGEDFKGGKVTRQSKYQVFYMDDRGRERSSYRDIMGYKDNNGVKVYYKKNL